MGWGWDPPPPSSAQSGAPPGRAAAPRCPPGCRGAGAAAALPYAEPHAKGISCNNSPPCPTPAPLQGNGAAYGVTAPSPPSCWGGTPILSLSPLHPAPKVCTPPTVGSAGDGGVPHGARLGQKKQSLVLCTGGTKDPPRPQTQPAQPSPSVACRGGGTLGSERWDSPHSKRKYSWESPRPVQSSLDPKTHLGTAKRKVPPGPPLGDKGGLEVGGSPPRPPPGQSPLGALPGR